MSGTRPFGESDIAYITRCRSEGVPFDFPDVIIDGLLATLDAARRASDAQVALTRADLETIEAEASAAHDYVWLEELLALVGKSPALLARQRQASEAIWSIHNLVRAALAATPAPQPASEAQVARPKPWLVRLTCCGRADGVFAADSWEEAEAFRQSYTSGPGVKGGHVEVPGLTGGHDRSAIIEDALAGDGPELAQPCGHTDHWSCATPAPQPATPPLDVERLALALQADGYDCDCSPDCGMVTARGYVAKWQHAENVATEYARLAEPRS